MNNSQPILITGTHRSGTTWLGEMLNFSPEVHYIFEPFAPMNHRSWLTKLPQSRFVYIPVGPHHQFDADLQAIVQLKPPWRAMAQRMDSVKDYMRLTEDMVKTRIARSRKARALIKDPFALFAAEWIHDRTDADVVILVRHPAAFVSSIKRLGWRLPVARLLDQPAILTDLLADFQAELEDDISAQNTIIEHACLIWRAFNSVVHKLAQEHPNWHVIRYEDIASSPAFGIQELCRKLSISYNDTFAARINEQNSSSHSVSVADGQKGTTKRDSLKAIWTWKERLTQSEIDFVRQSTEDVAQHWYQIDHDWD